MNHEILHRIKATKVKLSETFPVYGIAKYQYMQ